jgi:hypothetical protein
VTTSPGAPDLEAPAQVQPLFVVGDVHGHLAELQAALRARGLIGDNNEWTGGDARLWFLGDFTDRGPDGIGVIDLAMRLSGEAAEAGGSARMLLGNHEILLLGVYHVPDHAVPVMGGPTTFREIWLRNGGRPSDLERFTDEHSAWLCAQPVAARVDDYLLVHSDTAAYLEYGNSVEEIDGRVADILSEPDADTWWILFRDLTRRGAFGGEVGPLAANDVLGQLGGRTIVHGHTPIPYQTGADPSTVVEPRVYADGHAINLDGGIYLGGRCLVTPLPLPKSKAKPNAGSDDDTIGMMYGLDDAEDEPKS